MLGSIRDRRLVDGAGLEVGHDVSIISGGEVIDVAHDCGRLQVQRGAEFVMTGVDEGLRLELSDCLEPSFCLANYVIDRGLGYLLRILYQAANDGGPFRSLRFEFTEFVEDCADGRALDVLERGFDTGRIDVDISWTGFSAELRCLCRLSEFVPELRGAETVFGGGTLRRGDPDIAWDRIVRTGRRPVRWRSRATDRIRFAVDRRVNRSHIPQSSDQVWFVEEGRLGPVLPGARFVPVTGLGKSRVRLLVERVRPAEEEVIASPGGGNVEEPTLFGALSASLVFAHVLVRRRIGLTVHVLGLRGLETENWISVDPFEVPFGNAGAHVESTGDLGDDDDGEFEAFSGVNGSQLNALDIAWNGRFARVVITITCLLDSIDDGSDRLGTPFFPVPELLAELLDVGDGLLWPVVGADADKIPGVVDHGQKSVLQSWTRSCSPRPARVRHWEIRSLAACNSGLAPCSPSHRLSSGAYAAVSDWSVNPNSGERNAVTIPDVCLEEARAVITVSQFELRLEELNERAGEVTLILSAGRIVVVVGLGRRKSAEAGSKRLVDEESWAGISASSTASRAVSSNRRPRMFRSVRALRVSSLSLGY